MSVCKSINAYGITLKMHPSRHSCSFAEVVYMTHKRAVWKSQRTLTWYLMAAEFLDATDVFNKTSIRYFYMKGEDPALHKGLTLKQV